MNIYTYVYTHIHMRTYTQTHIDRNSPRCQKRKGTYQYTGALQNNTPRNQYQIRECEMMGFMNARLDEIADVLHKNPLEK